VVADGTEPAAHRLENVLIGDTGIGVLRYADAGYDKAIETAQEKELRSLQPNVQEEKS
jgi:urocanate hydratase